MSKENKKVKTKKNHTHTQFTIKSINLPIIMIIAANTMNSHHGKTVVATIGSGH